jgi:hypothetical protein
VIKARRMRWAKHVASFMGEMRIAYRISVRKHKGEETTWKTYT